MTTARTERFLMSKPETIEKKNLLNSLKKIQEENELSWLITDKRSYGWEEINQKKQKFLEELKTSNFKTVCVGVFEETKETKYSSYKVKSGKKFP